MRNFWDKIKNFFRQAWNGLTTAGKVIAGLIIIGLVGLTVYAASEKQSNNNEENKDNPEVAQVYEPSIGSPLPADQARPGEVGGASTTEPAAAPAPTETPERVAPATGIDPNAPVKYRSEQLGFASTLPAGSTVQETDSQIKFTDTNGQLLFMVSVNAGTDSLQSLESQLQNSPSVTNISRAQFANLPSLKFTVANYGSGTAFVYDGKTYYLYGTAQYFSAFALL